MEPRKRPLGSRGAGCRELELRHAPDGLAYLRSPTLAALGVAHAFTTRRGPGGFEFDLRTIVPPRIAALESALGERSRPLRALRQVHGRDVVVLEACAGAPFFAGSRENAPAALPAADALFARGLDHWLAVRTADCVPILVAALDGRAVAAVHAGWRGLVAGVIEAALQPFAGVPFAAAVGPCLSLARCEIGPEVARAFADAGLSTAVDRTRGPRPHADLRAAAVHELTRLGASAIDTTAHCTWDDEHLFFSHRRDVTHGDLERAGHQAALIAPAREWLS